jgi:C4-dicarboxylate-specific signal transduction histidine kinase
LEASRDQLIHAEKMAALGSLVAGVAHEINTPVGISVTAASYLQEALRGLQQRYAEQQMTRRELESFLEMTEESCRILVSNLQRAAQQVRSFRQVASDQSQEARREFELCSYLQEVLLSLRPRLKKIFTMSYLSLISREHWVLLIPSMMRGYPAARSPTAMSGPGH